MAILICIIVYMLLAPPICCFIGCCMHKGLGDNEEWQ